jgi:hypothetical protein
MFQLTTHDGHPATLLVEAATPQSVAQAKLLYAATAQVTVLRPEATVPGLGEQAEAFTRTSGSKVLKSEYLVHARAGNLVVKVWLAVNGTTTTATASLAEPTRQITAAVLALVPPA